MFLIENLINSLMIIIFYLSCTFHQFLGRNQNSFHFALFFSNSKGSFKISVLIICVHIDKEMRCTNDNLLLGHNHMSIPILTEFSFIGGVSSH